MIRWHNRIQRECIQEKFRLVFLGWLRSWKFLVWIIILGGMIEVLKFFGLSYVHNIFWEQLFCRKTEYDIRISRSHFISSWLRNSFEVRVKEKSISPWWILWSNKKHNTAQTNNMKRPWLVLCIAKRAAFQPCWTHMKN